MKNQKFVGFYGGTFNPIHLGHLNLAIELMEAHQLDQVWFCPAAVNPHKTEAPPIPIEHRLAMIRLAIEEIPQFRLIDCECKRHPPSYTSDTLREIQDPSIKLFILLGEDALSGFPMWKKPEEIVTLAKPLIGLRSSKKALPECSATLRKSLEQGITPIHQLDISSTEIRERLKKGLYCGHLVPSKVLDYIYHNHLYSSL